MAAQRSRGAFRIYTLAGRPLQRRPRNPTPHSYLLLPRFDSAVMSNTNTGPTESPEGREGQIPSSQRGVVLGKRPADPSSGLSWVPPKKQ